MAIILLLFFQQRASNVSSLDSRRDLDEMLSSLGVAPVKDVLSSLSSITSLTPPQTASPDASLPHTDKSSLPVPGYVPLNFSHILMSKYM